MSEPKTVWILAGYYEGDCDNNLAVLDTEEEAQRLKKWGEDNVAGGAYRGHLFGYDGLRVEKWEIGELSDRITDAMKPKEAQ